jgi:hypothetical protein
MNWVGLLVGSNADMRGFQFFTCRFGHFEYVSKHSGACVWRRKLSSRLK